MKKKTIRKYGFLLLKILVFLASWGYIVYKFQDIDGEVFTFFSEVRFGVSVIILLAFLMICNWGIEIIKWKRVTSQIQEISWKTAIMGVLAGLPLALITPNRIGEIGGRVLVVKQHKKKMIFATFIGSFMQLLTTLIFGFVGLLIYLLFLPAFKELTVAAIISIIVFVLVFSLYVIFKRRRWVYQIVLKGAGKSYYKKLIKLTTQYTFSVVSPILYLSMLRYVVFFLQYCILLRLFIPELLFVHWFVGVTLTYLYSTLVPASMLGELGVRGSVAMFVFSFFTTQELLVFQISVIMWIINLVLPTLLGAVVILAKRNK